MKRIAIVVQRCHASVVGGSEALAWQYARLLSSRYEVEILSSTASDYMTWKNDLPRRRRRCATAFRCIAFRSRSRATSTGSSCTRACCARCTRRASSRAPSVRTGAKRSKTSSSVFRDRTARRCTRIWPSNAGSLRGGRVLHVSLSDDVFRHPRRAAGKGDPGADAARRAAGVSIACSPQRYGRYPNRIWLTDSEQRVAKRLWNSDEGEVIGMAVEHTESTEPERRAKPYFLYCGRIEEGKGCRELLDAFFRFRKHSRTDATLVLTGVDNMRLPQRCGHRVPRLRRRESASSR